MLWQPQFIHGYISLLCEYLVSIVYCALCHGIGSNVFAAQSAFPEEKEKAFKAHTAAQSCNGCFPWTQRISDQYRDAVIGPYTT